MKLSQLPDGHRVTVDTETSKLHPDDGGRIAAVSLAFRAPDGRLVKKAIPFDQGINGLPLGDKDLSASHIKRLSRWPDWALDEDANNLGPDEFVRLCNELKRFQLAWHNAKFDMRMFKAGLRGRPDLGVDFQNETIWDTMTTQRVVDPKWPVALKQTAVRLHLGAELGVKEGMEDDEAEALKPWLGPKTGKNQDPRYDLVPWSVMGPYAGMDAALTLLLMEWQWALLDEELRFQMHHVSREKDLMTVLYRMELRGVGFDVATGRRMAEMIEAARRGVAAEIPFRSPTTGDPSPPAAAKYFFDELEHEPFEDKLTEKARRPQVDDEVITRLVKEDWIGQEVAKKYQWHENLKSANAKWYMAWPEATGADGRIRTDFKQADVVSGRLAVGRVQLQAIPHNYQLPKLEGLVGVRDLFVETEQCPCGCGTLEMWEFDVSQAEIRIATAQAQCRPMLEGFQRGLDSHTIATMLMFGDVFKAEGFEGRETEYERWDEFRQIGKRAQPLDEPVATPGGWKPMGDIKVGDLVLGSNGEATKVVAVPYRGTDEVWEVRTRSGRVVRCCGDHLWTIRTGRGHIRTVSTRELAKMSGANRDSTAYLPMSPVAQFDPVDLPIDPYLLGMLLGDGTMVYANPRWTSTTVDGTEIVNRVADKTTDTIHRVTHNSSPDASRYALRGGQTQKALVELGLAGAWGIDKHIPEVYLRGSKEQRYELLRGLMDTDGCATKDGKNLFSSTSKQLIDAMVELVRSLGGTATVRPMHKSRREQNPHWAEAWFVAIRTPECPFALSRKVARWKPPTQTYDRIDEVTATGQVVDQQCITVDAEDGLYLTKGYAVTHNCNLGILYGAGAGVLQEQIMKFVGIKYPIPLIRGWIEDWNNAFPQMGARLELLEWRAINLGYVELINGRQRFFSAFEPLHKAFNQEIQGSLAEVMKDIMIEVENRVPNSLLLQIHDSLTLKVAPHALAEVSATVTAIMKRRFERAFTQRWKDTGEIVTVPFLSDAKRFGKSAPTRTPGDSEIDFHLTANGEYVQQRPPRERVA